MIESNFFFTSHIANNKSIFCIGHNRTKAMNITIFRKCTIIPSSHNGRFNKSITFNTVDHYRFRS